WYAMQLVEGVTLRRYAAMGSPVQTQGSTQASEGSPQAADGSALNRAATRPEEDRGEARPLLHVLCLLHRLCSVLSFLHGEGIVPRDLKPDNILVRPDATPVLVDFGLAVQFTGEVSREALQSESLVAGTVAYVAPEQSRGELLDARADLYALGCIL